jgi:hypothetical protein
MLLLSLCCISSSYSLQHILCNEPELSPFSCPCRMVLQSVCPGADLSVRPYVCPLILPRLPVRIRLLGDTSDLFLQLGGPYLAVYLWAFLLVLSVFMMILYPVVIAPLFNTYTPVSGLETPSCRLFRPRLCDIACSHRNVGTPLW